MLLADARRMALIDEYAINKMKIPSTLLMENAARQAFNVALDMLGHDSGKKVAVFCGTGNNGGDGLCLARLFHTAGYQVGAYIVGNRERLKEDAAEMERRLNEAGLEAEVFDDKALLKDPPDLIIDAIFGIGFHGELREESRKAAILINSFACPVLAIDMPSGVDADSGFACDGAIKAHKTVTFTLKKPGQLIYPGREYCGKLILTDIGIPDEALKAVLPDVPETEETDSQFVFSLIGKRKRDSHKGSYGRVFALCSSEGYTGAGFFAAQGAVRTGSGLIYLGVPRSVYTVMASKLNEAMVLPLSDDGNGKLSIHALTVIPQYLDKCDVCLIGPGLGRSADIDSLVSGLLENAQIPVVLDADGINATQGNIHVLSRRISPTVLTPHEGEFKRLGGSNGPGGRLEAARNFAKANRCVIVLKGASSIIASPDGRVRINTTGNPGMAKGGSGDVLSGMIASLIGQGLDPFDAASCAVWLHGRAGDICAYKKGEYGMTPSDMLEAIPLAIGCKEADWLGG